MFFAYPLFEYIKSVDEVMRCQTREEFQEPVAYEGFRSQGKTLQQNVLVV